MTFTSVIETVATALATLIPTLALGGMILS